MKKIIIFDFNRTLYDPETNKLLPGARQILLTSKKAGFQLYLISRREKSRANLIESLGLKELFQKIVITRNKSKNDFGMILKLAKADKNESFVVGDRVREEISIGNSLGLKTVWLRNGKFSSEKARRVGERPTFVIRKLSHLKNILYR